MTKPVFVYGLYDGFSNRPFYVGVSTEPKRRLWAHRAAAAGKRLDAISGSQVKPEDMHMRLLATCEERYLAELIETALEEHYEIDVVRRKELKRSSK